MVENSTSVARVASSDERRIEKVRFRSFKLASKDSLTHEKALLDRIGTRSCIDMDSFYLLTSLSRRVFLIHAVSLPISVLLAFDALS